MVAGEERDWRDGHCAVELPDLVINEDEYTQLFVHDLHDLSAFFTSRPGSRHTLEYFGKPSTTAFLNDNVPLIVICYDNLELENTSKSQIRFMESSCGY